MPRIELHGHDEAQYCIAQELESLVRAEAFWRPLRMQERLPPQVRIKQVEQTGEVTG